MFLRREYMSEGTFSHVEAQIFITYQDDAVQFYNGDMWNDNSTIWYETEDTVFAKDTVFYYVYFLIVPTSSGVHVKIRYSHIKLILLNRGIL